MKQKLIKLLLSWLKALGYTNPDTVGLINLTKDYSKTYNEFHKFRVDFDIVTQYNQDLIMKLDIKDAYITSIKTEIEAKDEDIKELRESLIKCNEVSELYSFCRTREEDLIAQLAKCSSEKSIIDTRLKSYFTRHPELPALDADFVRKVLLTSGCEDSKITYAPDTVSVKHHSMVDRIYILYNNPMSLKIGNTLFRVERDIDLENLRYYLGIK